MSRSPSITEADILNEVIAPDRPGLNAEAAKSLLTLSFSETARDRIRELLAGKNRGALTDQDDAELEKYLRVGQLLDLLQAKARVSLAEDIPLG